MVMSTTEPRETPESSCACPVRTAPRSTVIETTLYDLLAVVSAAVGSDEDAVVTAVVVHLLQTHRVLYMRGRARYRLVWDGTERSTRSRRRAATQAGSAAVTRSA